MILKKNEAVALWGNLASEDLSKYVFPVKAGVVFLNNANLILKAYNEIMKEKENIEKSKNIPNKLIELGEEEIDLPFDYIDIKDIEYIKLPLNIINVIRIMLKGEE